MAELLGLRFPRFSRMSAQSLSEDTRLVVSKDQVSCDLAGEAAILNLKSGVYFGLDPVGARVWSLLQQPATLSHLCDALVEEYEVERPSLEIDLRDLLSELIAQGLVEVAK